MGNSETMKDAVVLVADQAYLDHAKHVLVNCKREGGWGGEFVLIVSDTTDTAEIDGRGIHIIRVPHHGFLMKFYLFGNLLNRWARVIYMDCDVVVIGQITVLLDDLESTPAGTILAQQEDGPAIGVFERNCKRESDHALLRELENNFPCIKKRFWNTSCLVYRPTSIPSDTVDRLFEIQETYHDTNDPATGGTDQQMIHLLLYSRFVEFPEKRVCYWGLDDPQNRVFSEFRGWTGDEIPVILHYCRWYAPWLVKTENMAAYTTDRIGGKPLRSFYLENLDAFGEVFPVL
jgi:hypothetical protein